MRLSDTIEQFIKLTLMQEATEIELKRNELAEYFRCAPSQINYVLSTRFTPAHGYIIESRRGGGGGIHIYRIVQEGQNPLLQIEQELEQPTDELTASHLIQQLCENGLIDKSQAALMQAAVSREALSIPLPTEMKDALRSHILRQMLHEVSKQQSKRPLPETTTYELTTL